MSYNASILLAIYFPLGIVLLGLGGYMYDELNKNGYFEKKYKNNIFDGHRLIIYLAYFAPIMFIYLGIKNKSIKYFIIGFIFIIIVIIAIIIGNIMLRIQ